MSFLSPLALTGLVLLVLPVLIHLLIRRRAERLDFPTLRFLRETPSFRLRPRRVREPLLLALRLAALALIIAGLARPFLSSAARGTRSRVILLDASLSMSTRGRAEAARQQARSILNKLARGERASVIAFASAPYVLADATDDGERLLKALDDYRPTGGAAHYGAGLAAADEVLRREAPGPSEIDIISDFQQSGLAAQGPDLQSSPISTAARLTPFAVGTQIERNAFLTDETVSRSAQEAVELSATEIVSSPEGESATRRHWTIDSSEASRPDIEWRTQSNGQLTGLLRANAPDDFDADDASFFAFTPARKEARALLVETAADGPYLGAALEAANAGHETRFVLERRQALPPSADALSSYALVVAVLHGGPNTEEVRVLSDYARSGGTVWLCLARDLDVEGWNALALTEQGSALPFTSLARMSGEQPFHLGALDADAPALASLGGGALAALRAVAVRDAYRIEPRERAATIARWNDATPALVSLDVGAGALLLLGSSPEREASDLGLSPALPALAASISRAASASRDEPLSRAAGEPVQLGIDPGTQIKVTDGQGHTTVLKARELAARSQNIFASPGIYRLEFSGRERFLAFNAPPAERTRALASPEQINSLMAESVRPQTTGAESDWRDRTERRGKLWRLMLCAAFILLVAELFLSLSKGRRVETSSGGFS